MSETKMRFREAEATTYIYLGTAYNSSYYISMPRRRLRSAGDALGHAADPRHRPLGAHRVHFLGGQGGLGP